MISSAGTVERLRKNNEALRVYFDDPDSWLFSDGAVTELERKKLSNLDSQLLAPLSYGEKMPGIMSLGPKRSEEPYSKSDVQLLKNVATQTGLALENSHLTQAIATEVAQRERMNRDLEIAREVQERLVSADLSGSAGTGLRGTLPSGAWRGRRLLRFSGAAQRSFRRGDRRCFGKGHSRGAADGVLAGFLAWAGDQRRR